MGGNVVARYLLAFLVLAGIAIGLWTVGGPTTAAKQRRDELRLSGMSVLESTVECIANEQNGIVPPMIEPSGACLYLPPPTDPLSDRPYVFTRTGDKTYTICAEFETDLDALPDFMQLGFDPSTGCFSYSIDE